MLQVLSFTVPKGEAIGFLGPNGAGKTTTIHMLLGITRMQALAWSLVALFQPFTAAFFPLSVLPKTLQAVAYLFPPTYVFEAARAALVSPAVNWQYAGIALALNLLYLVLGAWAFHIMFRRSKETGQFARNEH